MLVMSKRISEVRLDTFYDRDCGSAIQKRLIIFDQISLKTSIFTFKTDIENFRNKELKSEIFVRVGFLVAL